MGDTVDTDGWSQTTRGANLGASPDELLSVPGRASGATLYVVVRPGRNLSASDRATALVRCDLVAGLMGARSLVGSAFLPIGASGIAVSASGWHVDAWHGAFSSNVAGLQVDARLAVDQCCGGGGPPRVRVPQRWRPTSISEDQAILVDGEGFNDNRGRLASPVEERIGVYRTQSFIAGPGGGVIDVRAGERVLWVHGRTQLGNPTGSVTMPDRETTTTIPLSTTAWLSMNPGGTLVGPAEITGTEGAIVVVESVR